jgi:hypothetical protein
MSHPLTIRNSNGFQAKMFDTCIRWNKATTISISTSTNVFLFPYQFRLLPFPFDCFIYFLETKLGQSRISIIVFTPKDDHRWPSPPLAPTRPSHVFPFLPLGLPPLAAQSSRPEHQHNCLLPHTNASFPTPHPPPCSQCAPCPHRSRPGSRSGLSSRHHRVQTLQLNNRQPQPRASDRRRCWSPISLGHDTGSVAALPSGCTIHLTGCHVVTLSLSSSKSKPYNQTTVNPNRHRRRRHRHRRSPISLGHGTETVALSLSPSGCSATQSSSTQASLTTAVESTPDRGHHVVTVGSSTSGCGAALTSLTQALWHPSEFSILDGNNTTPRCLLLPWTNVLTNDAKKDISRHKSRLMMLVVTKTLCH